MSQVASQFEEEFHLLREAFMQVVNPPNPGAFRGTSPQLKGVCDNNDGVQWSCWIERDELGSTTRYFSVNLEGKEYDKWPVARLIRYELNRPTILEAREQIEYPELTEVLWTRDAWTTGGNRLPKFKEQLIPPTPIALDRLSADGWRLALLKAKMSMATSEGGRRKLMVTLSDNQIREYPVTPHLNVRQRLPGAENPEQLEQSMRETQQNLFPVYNWVRNRTRKDALPPLSSN